MLHVACPLQHAVLTVHLCSSHPFTEANVFRLIYSFSGLASRAVPFWESSSSRGASFFSDSDIWDIYEITELFTWVNTPKNQDISVLQRGWEHHSLSLWMQYYIWTLGGVFAPYYYITICSSVALVWTNCVFSLSGWALAWLRQGEAFLFKSLQEWSYVELWGLHTSQLSVGVAEPDRGWGRWGRWGWLTTSAGRYKLRCVFKCLKTPECH